METTCVSADDGTQKWKVGEKGKQKLPPKENYFRNGSVLMFLKFLAVEVIVPCFLLVCFSDKVNRNLTS